MAWRKKIIQNEKGMTLVEVLVGFTILLVAISVLYTSTTFSLNLMGRAVDMQNQTDALMEAFYMGSQSLQDSVTVHISDGDKGFTFSLGTGRQSYEHVNLYFFGEAGKK